MFGGGGRCGEGEGGKGEVFGCPAPQVKACEHTSLRRRAVEVGAGASSKRLGTSWGAG